MMSAKKSTPKTAKKKSTKSAAIPVKKGIARALVVSLTHVDRKKYSGWDGRGGCCGCGIDAARISEALRLSGYQVSALADDAANKKSVLKALQKAAADTQSGDTFFFYFSGHGGQMPDANGDEAPEAGGRPGADETLVLYDAELVDDLLDDVWKSFPSGSVVYMLSDSCNSGTNYRDLSTRGPTPIRPVSRSVSAKMKAALLHIGGCRDAFTAAGEDDGGVFTKALLQAWNGGRGPGNWKDLHEAVCSAVSGQFPQINTYGKNAKVLLHAPPFLPWSATSVREKMTQDFPESGEIPSHAIEEAEEAEAGVVMARGAEGPPIGETQARKATRWLMTHFGDSLRRAGEGTPFGPDILCAIVCQETAVYWLPLLAKLEKDPSFQDDPSEIVDLILGRCVLDASGDYPGTSRSAFPKNTAAFRDRFGSEFANMLIEEANLGRAVRSFGPKQWIYKGYGLFQYDLQFVLEDEDFFRERRWYDFAACLEKCLHELNEKRKRFPNDLWETIRAYNGAGPRAIQYSKNVKIFSKWTADEIAKMAGPVTRSADGPVTARGGNLPGSKPRLTQDKLAEKLAPFDLDRTKHPLVVVGIRGYYKDTMGVPGVNDRGIYDDAIFIDTPDTFAAFNGNTDPSKHKPGSGFGESKGMAKLKPGAWFSHKLDFHGSKVFGPYRAICQRLGKVTVTRDGKNGADYEDTGDFGINIHKGSFNGTSSLGCQTIHPDQWQSFIAMAMDLAKRYHGDHWEKTVIPYILIED
jgi:Caspase domain